MYHKYLEVKTCNTGVGVFSKTLIEANSPIIEFTGSIIPKEKALLDNVEFLQVTSGKVIGPSGDTDDYINHSCDPNCYVHIVGNRAILYSLYVIKSGMELTFDYSTCSTDDISDWKMLCKCNSYKCRGVISGYQNLTDSLKKEYMDKGFIPLFITQPGLTHK